MGDPPSFSTGVELWIYQEHKTGEASFSCHLEFLKCRELCMSGVKKFHVDYAKLTRHHLSSLPRGERYFVVPSRRVHQVLKPTRGHGGLCRFLYFVQTGVFFFLLNVNTAAT